MLRPSSDGALQRLHVGGRHGVGIPGLLDAPDEVKEGACRLPKVNLIPVDHFDFKIVRRHAHLLPELGPCLQRGHVLTPSPIPATPSSA